jgi:hypothetical protein
MHIRDWPAPERPREKLLARGAAVLSDAELLALFLGSGLRGMDAVATARALLSAHGPLRTLLERSATDLAQLPGIGPARACQLSAALELCNRYLAAGLERGEALTDPAYAGRYFSQRLRGHPQEVFAPCSWTRAIARWRSRNCSAARWTAPRCIRARSYAAHWRTTRRLSSSATTTHRAVPNRAPPTAP